jgi:hypothetical protein
MKKVLIIGLIVALAFIIVGGVGVAYASMNGNDARAAFTVSRFASGDEVVRQFSSGPGRMMGQYYDDGTCPGGFEQGYGPGGMMGGYANGGCPGGNTNGYGPGGMMGRRGNGFGPGMMGGRGFAQGEGIMHDYMILAFAGVVGLTVDEVNTRITEGESLKEIAIAQGTTEDQLPELITQVRQAALDLAVADGVITQNQAELMIERMNQYRGQGFGPGFNTGDCPMFDGDETQQP